MRFHLLPGLAAAFTTLVAAEDLLFVDTLQYVEYTEATTKLGYTAKVVTEAEWRAMTTADFAKYKAIILSDPNCVESPTPIGFVEETKAVWSPAISGNMILIGTDPTWHSGDEPGAVTLIDNSVRFAASGSGTGLYFSLSCYWTDTESATVEALSEFGVFKVRGSLNCYNDAHIVASSEAMTSLDDEALSDWSCSVHEAFSEYPTSGVGGFQALAIAENILGVGSQSFGDGTNGLPYIISRGATPAGCGNSIYEPRFNEECDHGSSNGAAGDLCDKSCKCLYGVLDSAAGTCKPAPPVSSGTPGGIYPNATTPVPYPVVPPTSSPTPCGATIIGIEIIKIVEIVEVCPEGSTVTTTVTTCLSTLQRPIYATTTEGYPCYACVLAKPSPTDFITVITETCPGTSNPTPTVTYKMCSSCAEKTLTTDTIPGYTPTATACHGCASYVVEIPHEHRPSAPGSTAVPYTTVAPSAGVTSGKVPVTPTTSKTYYTAGAGKVQAGVFGGLVAAVVAAL